MKTYMRFIYIFIAALLVITISIFDSLKFYQDDFALSYSVISTFLFTLIWVLANKLLKIYSIEFITKTSKEVFLAWSITTIIGNLLSYWILRILSNPAMSNPLFSINNLLFFWIEGLIILFSWHFLFLYFYKIYFLKPKSNIMRKFTSFMGVVMVVTIIFVLAINLHIRQQNSDSIFSINELPHSDIAIVFGAGVYNTKYPSPVLSDRIELAATLYSATKIDKIILKRGW